MKKFLTGIVIFFVVIIFVDFIFGKIMFYAESLSNSRNYHCMYEADEDILILGSSFAARNFVPSVIEDSLGISCYNAGQPGNGCIVAWARYNMYIKRHIPKLIIYTLTPGYDYLKTDDYSKYLNTIKPYYGCEESVVNMYKDLMPWSDSYILRSNFIKFNSYVAQLCYHCISKKNIGLQGYEPLYETFTPYETVDKCTIENYEIDIAKMVYLEKLFSDIKKRNIPIICVLTPEYPAYMDIGSSYSEGLQLCKKYDIPVVNHKYYEGISQNAKYFYDVGHLNDKGAKFYSSIFCDEIRKLLNTTSEPLRLPPDD